MDSLNNLDASGHDVGGLLPHDEIQPYSQRTERRMMLEQLAMAVLATSLLLVVI